jgi:ubiquitin carboxyl-terminal hydrolase 5/13
MLKLCVFPFVTGEEELPEAAPAEAAAPAAPALPVIDEGLVMQLVEMGFDINGCKKAVMNTQNMGEATNLSLRPTLKTGLVIISCQGINLVDHFYARQLFFAATPGIEAAMNWVMEHMGDEDFATPPVLPSGEAPVQPVNEEHLAMIISMGFTMDQAKKALKVRWSSYDAYCTSIYTIYGRALPLHLSVSYLVGNSKRWIISYICSS